MEKSKEIPHKKKLSPYDDSCVHVCQLLAVQRDVANRCPGIHSTCHFLVQNPLGVFPIKMPTGPVENYPPWNSQQVHPWKIGQAPKGQDCLESIHFSGVNSLLVLGSVCTSCSQIRIISHHVVLLGTCHQPTASPIACLYIWIQNCIGSCYSLCITRCYMLASYGIHGISIVNHHII